MQKQGAQKNSKGKKSSMIDKSKDICHACEKVGHWANECRSKNSTKKKNKKDSKEDHANDAEVLDAYYASEDNTTTTTQYIDSGASEHLTPN